MPAAPPPCRTRHTPNARSAAPAPCLACDAPPSCSLSPPPAAAQRGSRSARDQQRQCRCLAGVVGGGRAGGGGTTAVATAAAAAAAPAAAAPASKESGLDVDVMDDALAVCPALPCPLEPQLPAFLCQVVQSPGQGEEGREVGWGLPEAAEADMWMHAMREGRHVDARNARAVGCRSPPATT